MDLERKKENLFLVVKRKQAKTLTHTYTTRVSLNYIKAYETLKGNEKHISKLASAEAIFLFVDWSLSPAKKRERKLQKRMERKKSIFPIFSE